VAVVGKFQRALIPLLVPVGTLTPDPENARLHGDENMEAIRTSLATFSQVTPIVFWRYANDLIVIKGNGTYRAACELGWSHIAATEFEGSEVFARAYAIADNRTAELAQWDPERLAFQMDSINTQWDAGAEVEWKPAVVGWTAEALEDVAPRKPKESRAEAAAEPETIDAEFSEVETTIKAGDVFELRAENSSVVHRVMCGDSTNPEDVSKLVAGEKIALLHADGPYGAGKESDGVANDNLHGPALDAFQVSWWNACAYHLKDNGSAYIWGTAADLWRLWYFHLAPEAEGLPTVSRGLSIRNEVVWDKGSQPGMSSDEMRCFAPSTERALFLMLGDQELSIDSDQYWDGWEPLRQALEDERTKAGWKDKDVAKIVGLSVRMASHWFGKSQWLMIPEDRYLQLQQAGRSADAFQYPYEALRGVYDQLRTQYDAEVRAPFYASRTFFDNAHDNMTEVWSFPRVVGEERHGHATPKPVLMIARAIKSSCPPGEIVLEPFSGSGSTLIAAEETGRRCFTMELQPKYVATTIARWEAKTGSKAVLVSEAAAA
jgi:DNA modification methylase